jgi:hypothetical protein
MAASAHPNPIEKQHVTVAMIVNACMEITEEGLLKVVPVGIFCGVLK